MKIIQNFLKKWIEREKNLKKMRKNRNFGGIKWRDPDFSGGKNLGFLRL